MDEGLISKSGEERQDDTNNKQGTYPLHDGQSMHDLPYNVVATLVGHVTRYDDWLDLLPPNQKGSATARRASEYLTNSGWSWHCLPIMGVIHTKMQRSEVGSLLPHNARPRCAPSSEQYK